MRKKYYYNHLKRFGVFDEYIEYLKSLKEKYPEPLSFQDLIMMPPVERYDYSMFEEYESIFSMYKDISSCFNLSANVYNH